MEESFAECLNAPIGDVERSEIASEQHMIESDHDNETVHVVDEIQNEGEKEEENHLR